MFLTATSKTQQRFRNLIVQTSSKQQSSSITAALGQCSNNYVSLDLPDKYPHSYWFPVTVTKATQRTIHLLVPLLNTTLAIDQSEYTQFVCTSETRLSPCTMISKELIKTHPSIATLELPTNWNTLSESSEEYLSLFDPTT